MTHLTFVPQNLNDYIQSAAEISSKNGSNDDYIPRFFDSHNVLIIVFSFLGLGLLLAFTPCVLPMVPILSGIIVGQSKNIRNKKKSFALSLAYVIGMAITYAIAGVVIALIGSSIQAQLQKPLVIVSFSGLFVLLALSLFGFYELQLPAQLQRRVTALSNQQKGGHYVGAFLMGCLSTLIVSPCVSAPLVGVLAYIGQTGDVVLGALSLLALGLGMGIPLLLIGISADRILPKAGAWMGVVEKIFGFMMLGFAIWILSRMIPGPVGGYGDLFYPWSRFNSVHQSSSEKAIFKLIHSFDELDQQLALAKKKKQIVMLDFYADWCNSCVVMERTIFSRAEVREQLANILALRADLTKNNAFDQALLKKFHLVGPPTIIFFGVQGQELTSARIVGEVDVKEFLTRLAKIQ